MNDYGYIFLVFVVMMAISFAERALPFIASDWLKRQGWVEVIGEFLPLSVMVILVASSVVGASASHEGLPLPELAAVALTILIQWFFRNSLLSIFSGTALYVALLNGWFGI
jgi:branched-subunit amino acid transport protein AzlD